MLITNITYKLHRTNQKARSWAKGFSKIPWSVRKRFLTFVPSPLGNACYAGYYETFLNILNSSTKSHHKKDGHKKSQLPSKTKQPPMHHSLSNSCSTRSAKESQRCHPIPTHSNMQHPPTTTPSNKAVSIPASNTFPMKHLHHQKAKGKEIQKYNFV